MWLITWQEGELRVRLHRILTTVETMVTYRNGEATGFIGRGRQLAPREAARIATLARDYLEAALQHFGTATITGPLPALSDIRSRDRSEIVLASPPAQIPGTCEQITC